VDAKKTIWDGLPAWSPTTSDITAGVSQLAHVALRRTLAPEQNGFLCV
jgi:hypothetical protein